MINNPIIFVLAGGFGTRLKNLTETTPKPMLKINNRPFLEYKISNIRRSFPKSVIYLLTYYLSNVIEDFYNDRDSVKIIRECNPLGTGGSVKNAINILNLNCLTRLIVVNGDTYDNIDYNEMVNLKSKVNIACLKKNDCSKYNTVTINHNNVIVKFNKKNNGIQNEYVNAGCYYFNGIDFFEKISKTDFSLEDEFASYSKNHEINSFIYNGPFMDIGTPDDFNKMSRIIDKYEDKKL